MATQQELTAWIADLDVDLGLLATQVTTAAARAAAATETGERRLMQGQASHIRHQRNVLLARQRWLAAGVAAYQAAQSHPSHAASVPALRGVKSIPRQPSRANSA